MELKISCYWFFVNNRLAIYTNWLAALYYRYSQGFEFVHNQFIASCYLILYIDSRELLSYNWFATYWIWFTVLILEIYYPMKWFAVILNPLYRLLYRVYSYCIRCTVLSYPVNQLSPQCNIVVFGLSFILSNYMVSSKNAYLLKTTFIILFV